MFLTFDSISNKKPAMLFFFQPVCELQIVT